MTAKDLILSVAASVVFVSLYLSTAALGRIETRLEKIPMEERSKIELEVKAQPTCAEVPTTCGFPLTFYREHGETAEQFAARIKAFVKAFEASWGS